MFATNRSWSGWGAFYCRLFVEDAIFIESEGGYIPKKTVEGWDHACRNLRGPDIIDKARTDMGGYWVTAGLVLRFGLGPENEIISAPAPEIEGARVFILSA